MFQILEEKQNDLDRIRIINKKTGEYLSIIPRYGANINELLLRNKTGLHAILDGNNKKSDFDGGGIYNSAKMTPFPNRIEDGRYTFKGKKYQLDLNFVHEKNAIHGLICDKPFLASNKSTSESFGEMSLTYQYEHDNNGFPFTFETYISYKLVNGEGLVCTTKVTNNGNQAMPFGDGWHPYFTFDKKVDDIYLKFSSVHRVEVDYRYIPTGKIEQYNRFHTLTQVRDTTFLDGLSLKLLFQLPQSHRYF